MTLRVVIVDDEPVARRVLRELCVAEPDVEIAGECADGRAALEALRAQPVDVVFLDIQMDVMNGLAVARALGGAASPHIVFVTAYDQHALEAFELSAVDYLLKPFDEERFRHSLARLRRLQGGAGDAAAAPAAESAALQSLLRRLEAGATAARPRLLAESGGRLHVLDVARIELVEADRNYVRVSAGGDVYQARSTLQNAEQALASQPLLRISRSCLVNLDHVKEISRTPRGDFILVLAGGSTVTSSEGYRERVREQLNALRLAPG
ncbi:MAG: LytTR family DNA-binding domain-containing protein [Steroidobacteraceae bacterium]